MESLTGKDRLIVALDVPTVADALGVVQQLHDVSFFKVGLQLFMTGGLAALVERLRGDGKQVFVDLKLPGDIANTIAAVVDACVAMGATFLTFSESMPPPSIAAARAARRAKHSEHPRFLTVPLLSSLDGADLQTSGGDNQDVEGAIVDRARAALNAGCDGIIVSGQAIRACRRAFGRPALIVSPGIRPTGSPHDDHKRFTTPAEAIRLGADYLVVGRPILNDPDPPAAARQVIAEIDEALVSTASV